MITINPASILLAVLIWSVFALAITLFVKFARNVSPLLRYHMATATLIGLPVGLFLSLFMSMPTWLLTSSGPAQFVQNSMPAVMLSEIVIGGGAASVAEQSAESGFALTGSLAIYGLLIMMALGLLRLLYLYSSLKKQLKQAKAVDSVLVNDAFHAIKQRLSLPERVKLFRMDDTQIPFTAGFRNPVIVLPSQAIEQCSADETELIIMHESVHISRMDYLLHSIELMVRHLFWMHPLVHLLYRQATVMREMACDQEVMRNSASKADEYARILCQFALKPGAAPVFKAAMAHEHHLLTRIRQLSTLQNPNKQKVTTMKQSITLAAMALLLIAGAMACSDLTQNPDTDAVVLGMDDEIKLGSQTLTVGELRNMVAGVRDEITKALEDNETPELYHESMRETRELYNNVLMLIDNGQVSRAVSLFETLPPPPPPMPLPPSLPSPGDTLDENDDIFVVVEEMPKMIGGQQALLEALKYPEIAKENEIEGRVILQFIIDEQGDMRNLNVVRSSGDQSLDDAAVEAMSKMRFEPGVQRGQAVKVQMTQPVIFRF